MNESTTISMASMKSLPGGIRATTRVARTVFDLIKTVVMEDTSPAADVPKLTECASGDRDCVLVLDASGSMLEDDWQPTRLDGAKAAAREFARRLACEAPSTRVAVVAYGSSAKAECPLTPASRFGDISRDIEHIDCMGDTNMRAGLKEAFRLLDQHYRTCQVVLLTDGHNTGRSPMKIAAQLKEFAVVECVGIGGTPADVDEALLKDLASVHPNGTKRYRWIGNRDRLVEHFHELAGGLARS